VNYNELPLVLTPSDIQKLLGWKKDQVYNLFRSKTFPSERIKGKHIIPKPRFLKWLGENPYVE
jgi:hypothetical protein